jgi:hypothetical protein
VAAHLDWVNILHTEAAMSSHAERPETINRIRLRQRQLEAILKHVHNGRQAEEGVYLACDTFMHERQVDLLVRDFEPAPRRGLQLSARHISAHPAFIAGAVSFANRTRGSVIVGHSHPFSDAVQLTPLDREGEAEVVPRLQKRIPYAHHGTIIFAREAAVARFYRPGSSRAMTAELEIED